MFDGGRYVHQGIVIRAIGGYFRVLLDDGRVVETRARGRLRKEGVSVLVGDRVQVTVQSGDTGAIENVAPRRNALIRPPIANVDQVAIVTALENPPPNYGLLDRLLVAAAAVDIEPLLIWNKADLVATEAVSEAVAPYKSAGFPIIITSAKSAQGLEELKRALVGRVSTFAGPSGVGKSALLNSVHPQWQRETGAVNKRLGRGRHTTRAVELLPLPAGGLVADTPGFSTLDVRDIPPGELGRHWPDIAALAHECRFPGCRHRAEPDCAVRLAAEEGRLHARRYESYIDLLSEIEQWEARRYS